MFVPDEDDTGGRAGAMSGRPTGYVIAAILVVPALFTFLYRTLGYLGLAISAVIILGVGIPLVIRSRRRARDDRSGKNISGDDQDGTAK